MQVAEHGRTLEIELRAILSDIARKRTTKSGDVFCNIQNRLSKVEGLEGGELVIPEKDLKILDFSNQLRAKVKDVNGYLEGLKTTFIDITGGPDPEDPTNLAKMIGKTETEKVGHYMFPAEEGGEGNGAELEATLDDYVAFVKNILTEVGCEPSDLAFFKELTEDAEDSEIYKHDPNQEGKGFIQLAFESSPTPAAIATISEFKSKVLQYESAALDFLKNRVGAGEVEVKTKGCNSVITIQV